jgi:hypothetical protein
MPSTKTVAITPELIAAATRPSPWDVGNAVLYQLCRDHPAHTQADEIIAKLWLIGRTYAAAIERRRIKTSFSGDAFYIDHVAPKLIEWRIDSWMEGLPGHRDVSAANLEDVLTCHGRLTAAFYKLTKLDKRSLASKYLHFHHPRLFFIYDTRAEAALRRLSLARPTPAKSAPDVDQVYAAFARKCLALREHVKATHDIDLTPRQLDNLLLEVARRTAR